jgi:hypothetical protein
MLSPASQDIGRIATAMQSIPATGKPARSHTPTSRS